MKKPVQITSLAQASKVKEDLFEHYNQANLPCCIHGTYFNTSPRGCTAPAPDDKVRENEERYGMMLSKALDEFMACYKVSWEELKA